MNELRRRRTDDTTIKRRHEKVLNVRLPVTAKAFRPQEPFQTLSLSLSWECLLSMRRRPRTTWKGGDDDIWMASCRSSHSLSSFSRRLLLYRPPVDNVCSLGTKCPRKDEEVHGSIYSHEKPDYDRERRTVLANDERGTSVNESTSNDYRRRLPRIPRVDRAWIVRPEATFDDEVPSRRVVLIFVHGFNESYYRVISHLSHIHSRIPRMQGSEPWPLPKGNGMMVPISVVGFTWPSSAVFGVQRASTQLRALIRVLMSRENHIVLIGHSRGCEVVLTASTTGSTDSETDLLPRPISSLILIAAAIRADALDESGRFPRRHIEASRVVVMHSKADKVLRAATRFRPLRLLGIHGPTASSMLTRMDETVDMTEAVNAAHSIHTYVERDDGFFRIRIALEYCAGELFRALSVGRSRL